MACSVCNSGAHMLSINIYNNGHYDCAKREGGQTKIEVAFLAAGHNNREMIEKMYDLETVDKINIQLILGNRFETFRWFREKYNCRYSETVVETARMVGYDRPPHAEKYPAFYDYIKHVWCDGYDG